MSANGGSGRNTTMLLSGILVAGLALRLLHLWFVAQTPFVELPRVYADTDMNAFWEWTRTILAGDWLGRNTYHPFRNYMERFAPLDEWYRRWGGKEIYFWAPVYPYFVAGVLAIKDTLTFVFLVQVIIGSLQPLIMFYLARRLFDERAGLIAAALTAAYGPFIFFQTVLLRDWLLPLLESLIVLLALRAHESGRAGRWLTLGCVMGIAALTKESTLALGIVVTGWLMFQFGRPSWRAAKYFGLILAGFLVCLTPLLVRNAVVGAPLYAISTQGFGNIFLGLRADVDPVGFGLTPDDVIKAGLGTEGKLSNYIRESLGSFHGDYGALLHHQLLKVRGIVDSYEHPDNVTYFYGRDISPPLSIAVGYGLVFPLGLTGFALMLARWRQYSLVTLYLFVALAVQMLTMILARFRLTLVPVFILAAAFLVVRLIDLSRARNVPRVVGLLGIVAMITVVQQMWAPRQDPWATPSRHWQFLERHAAARVYASRGQYGLAAREMGQFRDKVRHAEAASDVFALASVEEGDYHLQWARDLLEKQKPDEARQRTLIAQQAYTEQARYSYPLYNLGTMYLKLGESEMGRGYLRQYLEKEPDGPQSAKARSLLDR